MAVDGGDLGPPGGTASPVRRGDVRLLGAFDEFLLGYADRTASLRPEHFARVVAGVERRAADYARYLGRELDLSVGAA